MNKIIEIKLKELIELAENQNDQSTAIVLQGFLGSKYACQDKLFAAECQKIVRGKLMPIIMQAKASNN